MLSVTDVAGLLFSLGIVGAGPETKRAGVWIQQTQVQELGLPWWRSG